MSKQRLNIGRIFLGIIVGLSFLFLLWTKLQLGLLRYFDADELAYLHWTHNIASGQLPYKDFLSYVPPGFFYALAPIFLFFDGIAPLMVGRTFAWIIFVGICMALGTIFVLLRRPQGTSLADTLWLFLLPGLFLAFLPLPADKFLEIRPDNLAILLSLMGLMCQVLWLGGRTKLAMWAGLLYGASLLVLPKTLPQVALASCVAFFQRGSFRFFGGIAAPLIVFAVWIVWVGDVSQTWYSLTKLPFEVNRIGEIFGMQPDLFFYPNAIYYGAYGVSSGLIFNHILWFVGLMVGVYRLLTPFLPHGRAGVWAELLVTGSLFVYVVTFIYGYPLRHAQYLIPIAVFVAWYLADVIVLVWNAAEKTTVGKFMFVGAFSLMIISMCNLFMTVNTPKLTLTNSEDNAILAYALSRIPKGSYVLDLVGATIYYRDPYYVSAVPFGQWEPYLSRPLPDLPTALEQTNTQYIYAGKLARVQTLSKANQAYIRDHFVPLKSHEGFLVRR